MIFIISLLVISCLGDGIFEEKTLQSTILNQEMKYSIYFPNGYTETIKYPIIYALHGLGTDHTCYNIALDQINEAIANGNFRPCVIVIPQAFNSFFVNKYDGTFDFEDYFFEEFMKHIEETYSVDTTKRAIMGISMGGFGSAYYSLIHQELFRSAVAMSPALLPASGFRLLPFVPKDLKDKVGVVVDVFGNEEYYVEHNFEGIVKTNPKGTFKTPIYGCIGQDDFLYGFVSSSGQTMKDYEMNHVWEDDTEGGHDVAYWMTKFPTAFAFVEDHWEPKSDNPTDDNKEPTQSDTEENENKEEPSDKDDDKTPSSPDNKVDPSKPSDEISGSMSTIIFTLTLILFVLF